MGTSQNDGEKKPVPPERSTVVLLLGTIGDTTWRMFIPTIGLTVLGLLADKWLHTTPWVMTVGIVLGALLAYVLVRRQIKKVKQSDE
jgi:Flp pilus assembly protein TadB